ncbi:MAG: OmpA family protein [Sulfuricurvum sp.]|nr:OmpA family protein [Sulfuricurvum sp.]
MTQESTYFGSLQNRWMESISDSKTNREDCERVVEAVKRELEARQVKEGDILAECRDGADPLYLENDEDAREKNYRVAVTLYATKIEHKVQNVAPKPKPSPVVAKPMVAAPPPPAPVPVVPAKPVEPDSDGDGVLDNSDQCKNTPKGYKVDEKGCPTEVTLHINFATASAKIPISASKDIADLLGFMKEYPAYSIDIVGHTDSVGESTSNQILSVKRAKALENTLVLAGISANRIIKLLASRVQFYDI